MSAAHSQFVNFPIVCDVNWFQNLILVYASHAKKIFVFDWCISGHRVRLLAPGVDFLNHVANKEFIQGILAESVHSEEWFVSTKGSNACNPV